MKIVNMLNILMAKETDRQSLIVLMASLSVHIVITRIPYDVITQDDSQKYNLKKEIDQLERRAWLLSAQAPAPVRSI